MACRLSPSACYNPRTTSYQCPILWQVRVTGFGRMHTQLAHKEAPTVTPLQCHVLVHDLNHGWV